MIECKPEDKYGRHGSIDSQIHIFPRGDYQGREYMKYKVTKREMKKKFIPQFTI
jgi:hypothetical protein